MKMKIGRGGFENGKVYFWLLVEQTLPQNGDQHLEGFSVSALW